jgi:predicted negative regulator of RcsB-dependent stress response
MADEEDIDVSKPKEPPKPVHIGGESLADRILPHLKKIIVSVIVLAVILSIFFGIRAWRQSKQSDETEKVAKVMQLAQRKIAPPPMPGGPPPDPDSFPDTKARAAAILDEAAKQGAELPPAVKGGLLLDKGDVDGAVREYKAGATKEGMEGVLSREGVGIALETKAMAEKDATARQKLLEEALAAFVAMQPKQDGYRRAYALYHQGRLQQVLGKPAEAKALFEQAKTAGASSSELAQLIDKRLASLGAS